MKAANPSHALALAIVDELARCGVRHAALAPGSRSAALAMAFDGHPGISLHVEIDERSAAFLALGVARVSGTPAAVVSTSGSATANFHPAIVEADQSRMPLLVLTADRPPELRHTGANQTIDQLGLYGGSVRWFCEVGVAEARPGSDRYWRSTAARAYATACGSPAGPVHLNLAFRDPLVPAGAGFGHDLGGRSGGRAWAVAARAPRPAAEADAAWLTDRVAETRRGVIVAGDGAGDPRPLLDLAAVLGWPVLAEPLSGARCGDHAISTFDLLLRHSRFADAHRPELAIIVGRVALSKPLLTWLDDRTEQVLVDRDGAWLDPNRTVARVIAGEPALVATEIAERTPRRQAGDWLAVWQAAERRARAALDAALDATHEPSEPRTARDLAELLPHGAVLCAASSMPVRDLNTVMRPRGGIRVIGNRGASGIDGFVSTALGAALAHDGPTFAVTGDLSLLHDQNGLLLADRGRLDLVMVVVNNDGGGIFSFLPQAHFPPSFERVFGTPHGLDLSRLAALYGCGHHRIGRAGELPAAIDDARRAGGVQLVEVGTDRAANVTLHRRLEEAVAGALVG